MPKQFPKIWAFLVIFLRDMHSATVESYLIIYEVIRTILPVLYFVVHRVLTRVKKSCWVLGTINLRTMDNEAVQSSLAFRCQIDQRIEDGVPGAPPGIFEFLVLSDGFEVERWL
jgi:hypothetical protein